MFQLLTLPPCSADTGMQSVPEMLAYLHTLMWFSGQEHFIEIFQLAGPDVQKQVSKSGSHTCTTKHFLFMSVTFIVTQTMYVLPTERMCLGKYNTAWPLRCEPSSDYTVVRTVLGSTASK